MSDLPQGTVTFLMTDIEGSTRLWENDRDGMASALEAHDRLIDSVVRAHAGVVVRPRGEGDSRFCVFPLASDAVAAALNVQLGLSQAHFAVSLRVRIAVHTGEAAVREGDYYGPAVNRCARIRGIAHGGQTILSNATEQLVRDSVPLGASLRDLGDLRLADLSRPERVFLLAHPDLEGSDDLPVPSVAAAELARGEAAVAAGDWMEARAAFEEALALHGSAEAALGLAMATWLQGESDQAMAAWERAFAIRSRAGEKPQAARIALRLGFEYESSLANRPAALGWFRRSEALLRECSSEQDRALLLLVRSYISDDVEESLTLADDARGRFRAVSQPDDEIYAILQMSKSEMTLGRTDDALALIDEAMAAVAGGDAQGLFTLADVCCTLVVTCEQASDPERLARWAAVVETFLGRHPDRSVFGFCPCCAAEVLGATGRWAEAEEKLTTFLPVIEQGCGTTRCVHPGPRLASLRIMQGRLEEAEQLLASYGDLPEAFQPRVLLHMERGQMGLAAEMLERMLEQVGRGDLRAAPSLSLLSRASIERGDLEAASAAAEDLAKLAASSNSERLRAQSDFVTGRVRRARSEGDAAALLQRSVDSFTQLRMTMDAAHARFELALALARTNGEAASEEGRIALHSFEQLGATRDADMVAAFLRSLAPFGRTGPKGDGELSARELEVVGLLSERLTNAEIGRRLFISTKTAGNHVSNILMKLGVTSRIEAGEWAKKHLPREQPAKK